MATSRYFQPLMTLLQTLDQSLTGQLDNFSSIASQLVSMVFPFIYCGMLIPQ